MLREKWNALMARAREVANLTLAQFEEVKRLEKSLKEALISKESL